MQWMPGSSRGTSGSSNSQTTLKLSPSLIFNAMDRLWGPSIMPEHVFLRTGNGCTKFDIRNSARPMACEPPGTETHLVVRLESYLTAYDRLPYPGDHIPEIVVRSARLPVLVGDDLYEPDVRINLDGIDPPDWPSNSATRPAMLYSSQSVGGKDIQ